MMAIALAVVLGLGALAFVLYPLFRQALTDEQDTAPVIAAKEQDTAFPSAIFEQSARVALQEVELDYQLGNIAEQDYQNLREQYFQRALVASKLRYEREKQIDQEIEEQVRKMRDSHGQAHI